MPTAFVALWAWSVWAADDAILDVLGAYEGVPDVAAFASMGPEAAGRLISVATDPAVPPSRRGRAVSALRLFPTSEVQAFLVGQFRTAPEAVLRRKAVGALAAGFGDAALNEVGEALASTDVQMRAAAAHALLAMGTPAAAALAAERRLVEPAGHVVSVLERVGAP